MTRPADAPRLASPGRHPLYAMDTCFYTPLGAYELEARCEMLRDLGYDGTYLTLWREVAWEDLRRVNRVAAESGLEVSGIYYVLDVALPPEETAKGRLARALETLEGCTNVELAVRCGDGSLAPSDSAGDGRARAHLEALLRLVEGRGIALSLYPHIRNWLERIEDATRLRRSIDHPALKLVFCGYHWFAVDGDFQALAGHLEAAAPYLRSANLCGSRRTPKGDPLPATLEPLDDGSLDNFALLGLLQRVGYRGQVGIQGYSVGGDVYAKLRRSRDAFRDIERRLAQHPHWAALRTDP